MYKMRIYIWGVILFLFIAINLISKIPKENEPITINSEVQYLRRNIDQKKVAGKKLYVVSKNAEINITTEPIDNYNYELFYSPFVAIVDNNCCSAFSDISNTLTVVRAGDFKTYFNAALEDKTYIELYPDKYSNIFNEEDKVKIAVIEGYELETKAQFLITFAGTTNITDDDIKEYMPKVNKLYEMAEKININDIRNFADNEENNIYIIIAPEYISSSTYGRSIISLGTAIRINYYVNYVQNREDVDLLNDIILQDKFMKKSLLRRDNYNGHYYSGIFSNSDWTITTIPVSLELKNKILENTTIKEKSILTENIYQDIEVENTEQKTESSVINNSLKEEYSNNESTNKNNEVEEISKSETTKEAIANNEEKQIDSQKIIDENRKIDENAYEENDEENLGCTVLYIVLVIFFIGLIGTFLFVLIQ